MGRLINLRFRNDSNYMRKSEKYKFDNNFVGPLEVIDANA